MAWHQDRAEADTRSAAKCDVPEADRHRQWAASLRWLIADKQPPAWKAATEKAFAELTTLEENWDSYGGKEIDPDHIAVARFVLDQIMDRDTPPPHVTPMCNGSVQLEWHRGGADLEIEICDAAVPVPKDGHVHYCLVLYDPTPNTEGNEQVTVYSLEDIDALRGALAKM